MNKLFKAGNKIIFIYVIMMGFAIELTDKAIHLGNRVSLHI
jgi:hypothetical protein